MRSLREGQTEPEVPLRRWHEDYIAFMQRGGNCTQCDKLLRYRNFYLKVTLTKPRPPGGEAFFA